MTHDTVSAFVLLLLVLDPFGTLPVFMSVMSSVPPRRRLWVALRESGVALAVLMLFMLGGEAFLRLLRLSERSLEVAGGVILLLIAIRIIFGSGQRLFDEVRADAGQREPLVFPVAVPLLAGPSAMATVMLLASRQPAQLANWVLALVAAMAVCAVVLMASDRLNRWLGESVVSAIEKLMGLILCAVAVEMILAGLTRYFGFAT